MASKHLQDSVISMLADQGAKNAAARLGMDLDAVTKVFNAELGDMEARLSVLLSHVEGRYESEIAALCKQVVVNEMYWPAVFATAVLGALIGFVATRVFYG